MEQYLFNSTIQLYALDGGVEMAHLTIDKNGQLKISKKDHETILDGDVKEFEYSYAGNGTNIGVKIYPRKFSFYKSGYEILFYDQAMDNPNGAASEAHDLKRKEFLRIVSTFNAYSGGSKQVVKMLLLGVIGIIILTSALVYIFSKAS